MAITSMTAESECEVVLGEEGVSGGDDHETKKLKKARQRLNRDAKRARKKLTK
jgi:hypothetical protein